MSDFYEPTDPSFDEQLRNVRVPHDLVARLRRIALAGDVDFDEALADVRVPPGLLARLRDVPVMSDVELDRQLRDTPIPMKFLDSLRQAICEEAVDAELDEALCDVPVPQGLAWRVRRASRASERRLRAARDLALAASLFLAVGLSYLGAVAGFVMTAFGVGSASREPTLVVQPRSSVVTKPEIVALELADVVAADPAPVAEPIAAARYAPKPPVVASSVAVDVPQILALPIDWDLGRNLSELMVDVAEAKWGKFLASPYVNEESDPPQEIDGPRPGGIAPVFAKGYDPRVHAKFGVHPFVPVDGFKHFHTSHPPLSSSTLSYEYARSEVRAGRRPNRDMVRIEEFLAAADYALPAAPRGQARVHVFGGQSPFAGRARLVQVAVNVGDSAEQKRSPVHLVVAVDVSESMSTDGRLDRVKQAVVRLIDRMRANDRVSVVAFNDESVVLAEQVERRNARRLKSVVNRLNTSGATNLGQALQTSYSLAKATEADQGLDRRIVVIGDGRAELTPDAQFRVGSLLSSATGEGIVIRFIDHSPRATASASISTLARAGGCVAFAAATSRELDWALSESVSSRSQLVLARAKLHVQFNPAVVTHYRLIGHGSRLLASKATADLRAGQVATALYEVETKPTVRAGDWIARAHVESYDAASSKRTRTQSVSIAGSELDAAFAEAAPSLQIATIAAQMGEAIKRSPYVEVTTKQALRRAADAAQLVHTDARELPNNRRLLAFLEQLRRVRSW